MKRIRIFLLLLILPAFSWGQSFYFTSGDTIVKTFEINDYTWAHTKIMNERDTSVIYQWEIITYNHPDDWEFSICDLPYCYTMGETTGTMYPATAHSTDAFLTVNIDANVPDTGFYQLTVWDQEFPTAKDTLTIKMIATPAYSGIDEENLTEPVFYFQETNSQFRIHNPTNDELTCVLFDMNGKVIFKLNLMPKEESVVYPSYLTAGIYLINFSKNGQTIKSNKVIAH